MPATVAPRTAWEAAFLEVAEYLPRPGLEALARRLREEPDALLSGDTLHGQTEHLRGPERVTAACPLAYCLWKGRGLDTVRELTAAFAGLHAGSKSTGIFTREWDNDHIAAGDLLALVERLLGEMDTPP